MKNLISTLLLPAALVLLTVSADRVEDERTGEPYLRVQIAIPPAEQARLAFANLNAILAAAGCSFDDVVDTTVFMLDPHAQFETIWEVVADYWGEAPYPNVTAVGVTWLAGFDFEIKVIARIPR